MASKKECIRMTDQENTLMELGFTRPEAESLRLISKALRRWYERECNGEIQRGDDGTARGYRVNARFLDPNDPRYWYKVADRETGARKRLAAILGRRNARITDDHSKDAEQYIHATCHAKLAGIVSAYIQTDPRGAALHIIRPGDVPEGGDVGAYYSRGVCVY